MKGRPCLPAGRKIVSAAGIFFIIVFLVAGRLPLAAQAQDSSASGARKATGPVVPETKISYQWFLAYAGGNDGGQNFNKFSINRGYINIASRFNKYVSTRITPDLTEDREGDGEGDLKLRLKYLYVMFSLPSRGIFTQPAVEFGLGHMPWIDFEEHINNYRCQGTLFMERNHLFNSADNGITFMSLLGGEMSDEYKRTVNGKYAGRRGSLALGLYNGGGYHALEKNQNKVFEARLTFRPLPEFAPGLQASYFLARCRGNSRLSPDWAVDALMLSLEHRQFVLTAQYCSATGNSGGSALDAAGIPREQEGYSLFGEYRIPGKPLSLIGRYDNFDENTTLSGHTTDRTILGLAYNFAGQNKALLDYDTVKYAATGEREGMTKFTIEISF
ncbi:MAG TPA: hypothetical protein VJ417_03200 [Candidatus Glassbacteria bacterium]|nr:hypothetical protein [Candidatus Glassbacteria bacterium]